jgi:large subunit ribosomal protein L22
MKIFAQHKNVRMTPRKVGTLREAVMGLPVVEANAQLSFQRGKAAKMMRKILMSAIANAKHNHEIEEDNLRVVNVEVGSGIKFKRHRPVSRGMAHAFVKRNSHIKIVIEEIKPSDKKKKKAKATEIDTLTVDELGKKDRAEKEKADTKEPADKNEGRDQAGQDKSVEAFQKKKIQQQGGDKKKTHRRKAI